MVAFLSVSDVFAVFPTGFGKSLCYASLHFAYGRLKRSQLCEHHPHTSGLHKSKFCVMPDPFPAEQFGKVLGYCRLIFIYKMGGSDYCLFRFTAFMCVILERSTSILWKS